MANHQESSELSMKLKEGTYKAVGCWYKSLSYDGSKALTRGTNGDDDPINVKFGDFGASDPEIASATGQTTYNVEFKSSFEDRVFAEYGVISEDGLTITLKGMMGTATLTWITDEEAKALEEDGDPIDCKWKSRSLPLGILINKCGLSFHLLVEATFNHVIAFLSQGQ